jgi:hypothetical protein
MLASRVVVIVVLPPTCSGAPPVSVVKPLPAGALEPSASARKSPVMERPDALSNASTSSPVLPASLAPVAPVPVPPRPLA